MSIDHAFANAKKIEIDAVVIRANGKREDLGTIAYWNKNPFMRFAWAFRKRLGSIFNHI